MNRFRRRGVEESSKVAGWINKVVGGWSGKVIPTMGILSADSARKE